MYDVLKRHRGLKLMGIALGLLLVWFIAKPATELIGGHYVDETSIVGTYANTGAHQVMIYGSGLGRMVSEATTEDFFYQYGEGVLECRSPNGQWRIRALKSGSLWNEYDRTFLYRRAEQ